MRSSYTELKGSLSCHHPQLLFGLRQEEVEHRWLRHFSSSCSGPVPREGCQLLLIRLRDGELPGFQRIEGIVVPCFDKTVYDISAAPGDQTLRSISVNSAVPRSDQGIGVNVHAPAAPHFINYQEFPMVAILPVKDPVDSP